MTYVEYMDSLLEQISNNRARQCVKQEIANHIEEQSEAYEAEGMEKEAALTEAVRQMGNPVETGAKLNQIHRPKMPWGLLGIAVVLTLMGIWIQSIVFSQISDNNTISSTYLGNTCFYNLIGFAVILGILFFDYNYLVKYTYLLYALYLIVTFVGSVVIWRYYQNMMFKYYLLMFYPIILAALIYRNRNKGAKGVFICQIATAVTVLLYLFCFYTGGGILECLIATTILLYLAVFKGIFGQKKKAAYVLTSIPVALGGVFAIICITIPERFLAAYQAARIQAIIHPEMYQNESGYIVSNLRKAAEKFTLFGNKELPFVPSTELYSDFVLSSIFSWFGILVGVLVVGLLLFFGIKALRVSLRQSNRVGMLVGSACSVSLLFRCVSYITINFGYNIYYTTSIPFLTYGLLGTLSNAVFVGLILCVYRNSDILAEADVKQKIRVLFKVEKVK